MIGILPQCSVVVDGNAGTGKSTLVVRLIELGYDAVEGGCPSRLVYDDLHVIRPNGVYVILDASVSVCRSRLQEANKDLSERRCRAGHMEWYRKKMHRVVTRLPACILIDTSHISPEETLRRALLFIRKYV